MSCAVVWFRHVHLQKQLPEIFFKKDVLKNSAKFTGKYLCWRLWGNMVGMGPSIQPHLQHMGTKVVHQLTSVNRLL